MARLSTAFGVTVLNYRSKVIKNRFEAGCDRIAFVVAIEKTFLKDNNTKKIAICAIEVKDNLTSAAILRLEKPMTLLIETANWKMPVDELFE